MMAAQGWLVFDITGQPLALGFVGAAQAIPGLIFNLVAGALADRFDPRRMILIGEGAAALLITTLAALVFTDVVEVWHIVVIAFLIGIATSFDQPARRVVWPSLIPRSEFLAGTALNQGAWNGTRVIGPGVSMGIIALIGVITGDDRLGVAISFMVIAAGFGTMAIAITFVRMPEIKRAGGATLLHDIVDGLAFVTEHRIFLLLLGLSFAIGYFGLSYQQLIPAFAKNSLGLGPSGVGVLYVSSGIGGVAGIIIAASYGANIDRAKLIGGGATLMGLTIIGFGISGILGWAILAVLLSALAGALYSIFQVGANTLLNLLVPAEFRGRVMGLRGIMWSLSPLGALQAGFIAGLTSTPFAIAVGGVGVLVATGLVFGLSKQVRNAENLVKNMEMKERATRL
jgi:MFS family permease